MTHLPYLLINVLCKSTDIQFMKLLIEREACLLVFVYILFWKLVLVYKADLYLLFFNISQR